MRILLRNFETGTFLKAGKEWTEDLGAARTFEGKDEAIGVARELRLEDIELWHVSANGTLLFGTRLQIGPYGPA